MGFLAALGTGSAIQMMFTGLPRPSGARNDTFGIGALGIEAAWLSYNINARFGGRAEIGKVAKRDAEDRPSCRSEII